MTGSWRVVPWFAVVLALLGAPSSGWATDLRDAPTGSEAHVGQAGAPDDDQAQARLMALYEQMVQFNLQGPHALAVSTIDSLMAQFGEREIGQKIAAWADYFYRRGDAAYRFGLAAGGYVSEGRLVDDFQTDCILFFYRVTELGRSSSALEAVQFAFGTRFYGAVLADVVDAEGRVDYGNSVHLDYTIDMIRSGIWGQEITDELGEAVSDAEGSTRYPPGTVRYVSKNAWSPEALRDGDVVYFVVDPATEYGQRLRKDGAMIGHVGIIKIEEGRPFLIHAAARGLGDIYPGGKVEKVALETYLGRVENFRGLLATRIVSF